MIKSKFAENELPLKQIVYKISWKSLKLRNFDYPNTHTCKKELEAP